jgi:hypothetical protein
VPIPEYRANPDCDDLSADAHPGAIDVWGDGTDSDCQNGDFPSCDVISSGEPLQRVLPSSTCGTGEPDIYLSEMALCGGSCPTSGSLWGFVANIGDGQFPGPVSLRWRDDKGKSGTVQVTSSVLPSGETSPMFQVPIDMATEVNLSLVAQDCDTKNNVRLLTYPAGDLTCL